MSVDKKQKTIIFTFATLIIILIFGILGYLGINNFNSWKTSESNKMLIQSQKEPIIKDKLLLAQKAYLLEKNENTILGLAKAANLFGDHNLANEKLNEIKNFETLKDWDNQNSNHFNIYFKLKVNYPQVASRYIRKVTSNQNLTRDELLILSEDFFDTDEFEAALNTALKSKELDKYYPQTYQQLIKIEEKLGMTEQMRFDRQFLSSITW